MRWIDNREIPTFPHWERACTILDKAAPTAACGSGSSTAPAPEATPVQVSVQRGQSDANRGPSSLGKGLLEAANFPGPIYVDRFPRRESSPKETRARELKTCHMRPHSRTTDDVRISRRPNFAARAKSPISLKRGFIRLPARWRMFCFSVFGGRHEDPNAKRRPGLTEAGDLDDRRGEERLAWRSC